MTIRRMGFACWIIKAKNKHLIFVVPCIMLYPLSYRVPVRERYGSTLLPAIIPVSSTCFEKLFYPSSGALDCVLQLMV